MKFLECVALGIVLTAGNVSADTLIHAGRLINGASDSAVTEMTVRVDGSQIKKIGSGYVAAGPDDRESDPTGPTLLLSPVRTGSNRCQ